VLTAQYYFSGLSSCKYLLNVTRIRPYLCHFILKYRIGVDISLDRPVSVRCLTPTKDIHGIRLLAASGGIPCGVVKDQRKNEGKPFVSSKPLPMTTETKKQGFELEFCLQIKACQQKNVAKVSFLLFHKLAKECWGSKKMNDSRDSNLSLGRYNQSKCPSLKVAQLTMNISVVLVALSLHGNPHPQSSSAST